ncbi:MAG: hypothetical protein GC181_10755 [Bacteroidetes bacterium]|nr:hypothetical protein [Bacteroidota bacterium]
MKPTDFPYNSIHDYLDQIFIDENPDAQKVKEAKREYWKLYNRYLKRDQRRQGKTLHIKLPIEQYQKIQQMARNQGTTASSIIKSWIDQPGTSYHRMSTALPIEIQRICFDVLHTMEIRPVAHVDVQKSAYNGLLAILTLTEQIQQS